jgi:hypothetical protein
MLYWMHILSSVGDQANLGCSNLTVKLRLECK